MSDFYCPSGGVYLSASKSIDIWVPVSFFRHGPASFYYSIYFVVQTFCIVLSFLVVVSSIALALNYRVYHTNMLAVYIFFSVHWFELLISKVFLMPYQEGWIEISDAEKNRNICESDCHRYFPLVLGGFIRSRFILLSCLAMPSLILERLLATKNVRDYEHVPRKYIPIAIIIFVEIISTIAAFSTILSFLGSVTILAACAFANSTAFCYFPYLTYRNHRLIGFMKSFPIGNRKYTLTKKYQIEENLRVLKAIKYVIIMTAAVCAIVFSASFLIVFEILPPGAKIVDQLLIELLVYCYPMMIHPVCIIATPKWRRVSFNLLCTFFNPKFEGNRHSIVRIPSMTDQSIKQQSDVYFNTLKASW